MCFAGGPEAVPKLFLRVRFSGPDFDPHLSYHALLQFSFQGLELAPKMRPTNNIFRHVSWFQVVRALRIFLLCPSPFLGHQRTVAACPLLPRSQHEPFSRMIISGTSLTQVSWQSVPRLLCQLEFVLTGNSFQGTFGVLPIDKSHFH